MTGKGNEERLPAKRRSRLSCPSWDRTRTLLIQSAGPRAKKTEQFDRKWRPDEHRRPVGLTPMPAYVRRNACKTLVESSARLSLPLVQERVGASDTAPDSQSHYLLAVAREFFEGHPTPAAIVAQIETRSVARELRDHPNRSLLLPRLGPPAPID
jgi:hypothetical protein